MSKIESGKFSLVREAFSLHETLEEVTRIIMPKCADKHIEFTRRFTVIPSTGVQGDRLRLKQVFFNLLGNAVKFTPEGGKILFSAETLEETETTLRVTFQIRDTGIGMTEAQLEKLFTAFEQADKDIAVRYGGTGLGLAISQNLVEMMGSKIRVHSGPGKGSSFCFTLAMEKSDSLCAPETEKDAALPDFTGKRILLVEDIEINRVILKELLADTRLTIDEAVDGKQAVDKFSQSPEKWYDLVFMDIQMPNMDGYEATRKIRNLHRPEAAGVPIIAMTANAYREDIERARQAGMDGHIAKPIDLNAVIRILSENLTVRDDASPQAKKKNA
jgi:CheY-like chemotaxis protein